MHLENISFFWRLPIAWIIGFVELYLCRGLQEAETVQQKPSWGWVKICSWLQWLQCSNLSDALPKMQNTFWILLGGWLDRGTLQRFQGRRPWKTRGFRLQERGDWGLRLSALCGYDVTCLNDWDSLTSTWLQLYRSICLRATSPSWVSEPWLFRMSKLGPQNPSRPVAWRQVLSKEEIGPHGAMTIDSEHRSRLHRLRSIVAGDAAQRDGYQKKKLLGSKMKNY